MSNMKEVIDNLLEVKLHSEEDFLVVAETLERIGICPRGKKDLYQSCHLLHKQGKYYIVHFLEMFLLDGRKSTITENDIARRNKIAKLLQDWDLLIIVNPEKYENNMNVKGGIKVISFKQRSEYNLIPKYRIGTTK